MLEMSMERNLKLNFQTGWSSIKPIFERYLQLKSFIKKALMGLNSPVKLYQDDITVTHELLNVSKPVELVIEALGTTYCNLVTFEEIVKLHFTGLLARNLLEALENRLTTKSEKFKR